MTTSPTQTVLQQLRTAVLPQDLAQRTDGKLLSCFLEQREEAAFATLVKRHGPMVWGVCRRLLGHVDAEDAFQATFLVLFQKAATIKPREMVGNWLHGVAYQTALHARRTTVRRRAREKQVQPMPDTQAVQEDLWSQLQPLLDQELRRLPDRYRAVLVLCDLEGKTRKEAARHLKRPEGTVAGWLARARTLLARRLTRRGLTLSAGTLAALLADKAVSADVPPVVLSATIKAAGLLAAGQAMATGAISLKVVALTEGVLKTMLVTKLKMATLFLLTLGLLGLGTTVLTYRTLASVQDGPRDPFVQKDDRPPQKVQTPQTDPFADKQPGGNPATKQDKPTEGRSGDSDKVRALLKQRLDLLRKNADRLRQLYKENAVGEEVVRKAELRLYKAELDLCETTRARIAVLEKIVSVYRRIEDRIAELHKQGAASPDVVDDATLNRLEAEIALEREKAKMR
jgi:RNA polymerase sigma factor (sigma-70 family)